MSIYDNIKNTNVITLNQGATYSDTVTVKQPEGTPVNLTGYSVSSRIRALSGALVAEFTCTVATPTTGVIARTLSNTLTAAMVPSEYVGHVWGLKLTAPSGAVLPEIQGGVMVIANV